MHRHAADDPAVATILTTARDIHRIIVAFSAGRISAAHTAAAVAHAILAVPRQNALVTAAHPDPSRPGPIPCAPRRQPAGTAVGPSTPTTISTSRRNTVRHSARPAGRSRPPHIPEERRLMSERTVQRVGAKVVVRSIDNAGCTMRALTVTSKLRLQGSALAAALARPDVQSALTDVSWRTGAGHVTGVSVVCGGIEPQLIPVRDTATGAVAEAEVVWQGSDGALDQDLEELMPEGPQRTRFDWKNLGKFGPDVDDPRTAPLPADRATLRRPDRVSIRRGYLRPPLPVDTVARIVELRDQGLSFKKIGKALGIAAWTVSRYVRSFEEGD